MRNDKTKKTKGVDKMVVKAVQGLASFREKFLLDVISPSRKEFRASLRKMCGQFIFVKTQRRRTDTHGRSTILDGRRSERTHPPVTEETSERAFGLAPAAVSFSYCAELGWQSRLAVSVNFVGSCGPALQSIGWSRVEWSTLRVSAHSPRQGKAPPSLELGGWNLFAVCAYCLI